MYCLVLPILINTIYNMKNTILTLLFAVSSIFVFAQTNADVVGQWYNAEKDAVITLFEDG